jgi:CBS domain-containing protein
MLTYLLSTGDSKNVVRRFLPIFKRFGRRAEILASEIMSSLVVTVEVTSAIRDAAEEMWTKKIGCPIVVNNDGKLAGVITERDIIYACTKDMLKGEVSPPGFLTTL